MTERTTRNMCIFANFAVVEGAAGDHSRLKCAMIDASAGDVRTASDNAVVDSSSRDRRATADCRMVDVARRDRTIDGGRADHTPSNDCTATDPATTSNLEAWRQSDRGTSLDAHRTRDASSWYNTVEADIRIPVD